MSTEWHTLFRLRTIVPATIVGAAAFSICVQPAQAFFPPVPNGPNQVVEVPPTTPPVNPPTVPPIPPVPPPPFSPPPPPPFFPPPPPPPPPIPNKPVETPEPATVVMAGIGLAVAAVMRKKKQ